VSRSPVSIALVIRGLAHGASFVRIPKFSWAL
jgi:hypothetical protein